MTRAGHAEVAERPLQGRHGVLWRPGCRRCWPGPCAAGRAAGARSRPVWGAAGGPAWARRSPPPRAPAAHLGTRAPRPASGQPHARPPRTGGALGRLGDPRGRADQDPAQAPHHRGQRRGREHQPPEDRQREADHRRAVGGDDQAQAAGHRGPDRPRRREQTAVVPVAVGRGCPVPDERMPSTPRPTDAQPDQPPAPVLGRCPPQDQDGPVAEDTGTASPAGPNRPRTTTSRARPNGPPAPNPQPQDRQDGQHRQENPRTSTARGLRCPTTRAPARRSGRRGSRDLRAGGLRRAPAREAAVLLFVRVGIAAQTSMITGTIIGLRWVDLGEVLPSGRPDVLLEDAGVGDLLRSRSPSAR